MNENIDDNKCPKCGYEKTVRVGFNVNKKGKFPRRKCLNCGITFYEQENKKSEGK